MGTRQEEQQRKLDGQCELVKCKLESNRRLSPSDDPRKVAAADLAVAAGVTGKHEQRRRRVRQIIATLRERGEPIVSDLQGYWIAENAQDHADYTAWCKKSGLSRLVEAARDKRSEASQDASGQLKLPLEKMHL